MLYTPQQKKKMSGVITHTLLYIYLAQLEDMVCLPFIKATRVEQNQGLLLDVKCVFTIFDLRALLSWGWVMSTWTFEQVKL